MPRPRSKCSVATRSSRSTTNRPVKTAASAAGPGAQVTLLYRTLFAGLFSAAAGSEADEESPAADLSDGQRDGSVRADLDPWAYHAAAVASLASLASHVALLGDAVESLYHRTAQELMAEAARGWLRGAAAGGAA